MYDTVSCVARNSKDHLSSSNFFVALLEFWQLESLMANDYKVKHRKFIRVIKSQHSIYIYKYHGIRFQNDDNIYQTDETSLFKPILCIKFMLNTKQIWYMLDEHLVLNLCKQGGIHSSPKGNQTMLYQEKFYSEHGRLCVNDNRYHLAKIHLRGFRLPSHYGFFCPLQV